MDLVAIVESLLFASQEPLTLSQMAKAVKETAKDTRQVHEGDDTDPEPDWVADLIQVDEQQIQGGIETLIKHYEEDGRAFTLIERSSGWRICARAEYAEWCRALYPGKRPQRLSQPALETLAIIAYRQPITRAGVEAVRGVSVDSMVQQLLDRGLIKIEGRADLPGRPLLYGTTDSFLDHFGVRNVEELPNAGELRRVKLPTPEDKKEEESAAETEATPKEEQLSLEPAAETTETVHAAPADVSDEKPQSES